MKFKRWRRIKWWQIRYFWADFKNDFSYAWRENILFEKGISPYWRKLCMPCIIDEDGVFMYEKIQELTKKYGTLSEIMLGADRMTEHAELDNKYEIRKTNSEVHKE